MTIESDSPDKLYQYFVTEARVLLQTIEETLFSLLEEKTANKVHTLMRSAHTLKGSAASVEEQTISQIAHQLEDVFEALYAPELELDAELASLLFQGYECLKTSLDATLAGCAYDETVVLAQTTEVFTELANKLGNFLGREAPLLDSEELGFDVVGSIFADSIPADLQELENILKTENPEEIQPILYSQAEFFLDLASSYSLPGLAEIAQAIVQALENHPDSVIPIAQAALDNLRESCELVLAGDRATGGQVSSQLLDWTEAKINQQPGIIELEALTEEEKNSPISSTIEATLVESEDKALIISAQIAEKSLNYVSLDEISAIDRILQSIGPAEPENIASANDKPNSQSEINSASSPPDLALPTIRVVIKQLDLLNHTIGELLIDENQQNLQSEKVYSLAQEARQDFWRCQKQLGKIYEWSKKKNRRKPEKKANIAAFNLFPSSFNQSNSVILAEDKDLQIGFDELEMDVYSDLHLLLEKLNSKMNQLAEKIELVERELEKSNFYRGKRKQLLNRAQAELFQTRTIPLGTVLNRLPRALQLMVATHHKPAELHLSGTEVLVDKAIAEKLYEPLLHLLRNAYDHGIETSEIRQKQAKSITGQITIRAYNQGHRTIIEVRDDGQGLNWQSIRNQAVAKNLLSPSAAVEADTKQLAEILFEPGFSTAEKVTDLSGRGVGLDVVRNQLQSLQSTVRVSSQTGQGTTFTLQLPLNLTTARLLVCQSQGVTYALMSEAINQILLPSPEQIQRRQTITGDNSQTFFLWQQEKNEQLVPVYSLDNLVDYQYPLVLPEKNSVLSPFPLRQKEHRPNPLLMLHRDGDYLSLQVEQILIEQELVIKSLGKMPGLPDYIQGYTVLADTSLALVINPLELAEIAWQNNFSISFSQRQTKHPVISSEVNQASQPLSLPASPPIQSNSSTILVVEDSLVQRQSLVFTLKKAGYRVKQAENGKKALNQCKEAQDISLVICDVEMPVMNGFEFLQNCQQEPELSQIPVVMLTTRSGEKHRQLAFSLGAKAYLTKPYAESRLLATIANQLPHQSILST
ncbi:MAG: hybrid sensor histidine kinase/response regulator [Cyanobacteria bacterium J083]|nr:MAG: hybrid sensor histidine kinase/response regulator [Cyanobacteria bacterium J083]